MRLDCSWRAVEGEFYMKFIAAEASVEATRTTKQAHYFRPRSWCRLPVVAQLRYARGH
jgi:hypothetical protein